MGDTHLHVTMSDGTTMTIERLVDEKNFDKWLTEFNTIAEKKGYVNLFTGHEKMPGNKPNLEAYMPTSVFSSPDRNGQDLAQAQYEFDLEEFKAREERAHKAVILLYTSLGYDLRHLVRRLTNPKDAMDQVKKHFAQSRERCHEVHWQFGDSPTKAVGEQYATFLENQQKGTTNEQLAILDRKLDVLMKGNT